MRRYFECVNIIFLNRADALKQWFSQAPGPTACSLSKKSGLLTISGYIYIIQGALKYFLKLQNYGPFLSFLFFFHLLFFAMIYRNRFNSSRCNDCESRYFFFLSLWLLFLSAAFNSFFVTPNFPMVITC